MAIFDVTVLSEENKQIYHEKVFAMDEDTAMDQVLDELDKKGVPYGICMAEEMGQWSNEGVEDVVDEMLAILSDRDMLVRNQEMEQAQVKLNRIYRYGLKGTEGQ